MSWKFLMNVWKFKIKLTRCKLNDNFFWLRSVEFFMRRTSTHSTNRYYHIFNEYQWYWRRMCCCELISRNVDHVNSFWQFWWDLAKMQLKRCWFIGVILTKVLAIWRLLTAFLGILFTLFTFKQSVSLFLDLKISNFTIAWFHWKEYHML